MNGVALVNLVMGGYLLYDAFNRLAAHQSLLIFDDYLGGFARYIPILLAIGLILTAILLFVKKSTSWLFFSYVISFLVLLFYTPSVFYSGIEERYSPWILVFQFLVLITCTILLYATRERGKGSASVLHRETYSEYKKGMKQFEDPESKTGRKNSRPE
ncbi:hypothetical protein [Proteiniclasticum sp. QWL-01]|jgi:hypothetical protein|uniref:hypothetical protein n=1 Tax=Proteiniclasticum sp. QWL-01 TaxID=3036945 RepID=UPI002202684C|nr:hypothetical protein [Proteiniclasticum sp. QWL-01]UUM13029.1 hypothetical protein NQU17_05560 [Clostridiaceae bacterium HFYG-1003]WFF71454.1 hypothetical protein P6M73_09005 [Proteiniclasticum sp. QWL-01]